MKQALLILALIMLFLATTESAFGRSPKVASNLCRQNPEAVAINGSSDEADLTLARKYAQAWQVMSMHGVRYTPDVYLQFYADADLVAYLAGSSDLIVLPVYSPSPIHFRYGEMVLVSTGFILQSRSEQELFEAIGRDGGCPLAPADPARFSAVQAKLELGVAQYYEAMKPPLRCREITRLQLRRR
jgi:putative cell wall-binding protein